MNGRVDQSQTTLLHETALLALSSLDPAELATAATAHLLLCFGLDSCSILLPDEAGERLVLMEHAGRSERPAALLMRYRSLEVEAYRSGRRGAVTGPDPATLTHLAVPLRGSRHTIGVLVLEWAEPHVTKQGELELIERMADQLARGIENARVFAAESSGRALTEALARIYTMLLRSATTDDIAKGAVTEAVEALGAERAFFAVPEGQWWRIVWAVGYPAEITGHLYAHRLTPNLTEAARTREPQFVADVKGDWQKPSALSLLYGLASLMVLPLVTRRGIAAVLSCGYTQMQSFDEARIHVATRAADAVSLGYEAAQLFEEQEAVLGYSERLHEINSMLLSAKDYPQTLRDAMQQAAHLVGAGACALAVRGNDGWMLDDRIDTEGLLEVEAVLTEARTALEEWGPLAGTRGCREHCGADLWFGLAPVSIGVDRSTLLFVKEGAPFGAPEMDFVRKFAEALDISIREQRVRIEREWLSTQRQEWLSGVSHDLRTPLSSIRGYAELLASDFETPPDEVRRQASVIVHQSERIEGLIDDLLLTFRIREGVLPIERMVIDLHPVLAEVMELAAEDHHPAEGQFELVSIPGCYFADLDPKLLQRALKNLVSNAYTHNPPGTRVTLSVERADDILRIDVRDDGDGIDERLLPRIWQRFEQLDGHTRPSGGVGLGMSVSRQLIEAIGGSISIRSRPGEGTTVSIVLIAADASAQPREEQA